MGHEVSALACKIFYPLTAYFKRGDDAKVPAGGQDLRFPGCLVLARLHRGIKFNFERNLGGWRVGCTFGMCLRKRLRAHLGRIWGELDGAFESDLTARLRAT